MPFTSVIGVLLLLTRTDGHVLLGLRHNTGRLDGLWSLPAGTLDDGESVTAAMVREAHEELGVRLTEDELRFVATIHRRTASGSTNLTVVFHAAQLGRQPVNREPGKCAQLQWVPAAHLPAATTPNTRLAIELHATGQPFAVAGWKNTTTSTTTECRGTCP